MTAPASNGHYVKYWMSDALSFSLLGNPGALLPLGASGRCGPPLEIKALQKTTPTQGGA